MRILLIDPPFARFMGFYRFFFPFSLSSLSAYLKQHDSRHQILIYDADHGDKPVNMNSMDLIRVYHKYLKGVKETRHPIWREAGEVIRDFKPDLVGITFLSTKIAAVRHLTDLCRSLRPGVPVVLGGAHPTILPEASLEQTGADFIVMGEGEAAFAELADAVESGRRNFENIQGLAFRGPGGKTVVTPPRPLLPDLDALPFPDRESLHRLESYRPDDLSMIMTSRGCPFRCTFCTSIWERNVRHRSVVDIVDEIEYLIKRFGVRKIFFKDDTFTLSRKRVLTFCDELDRRGIKIVWECLTRIELVDEDLVMRMRRSGLDYLKIGIETGSPRLLQATNKNITLEQIRRGAAILNRIKQKWSAFFMLGYPDEKEEEIRKSWDLIREIRPTYVSMSILAPYPGCRIYYDLEEKGIIGEDTDWNLYDPFSLYANVSGAVEPRRFLKLAVATMRFIDEYNTYAGTRLPEISFPE
jgi:radical SAM superfamily enzyme YgiQ (UPF0313 family)